MSKRADRLWAVCGLALVALLAVAFQPEFAVRAASGMSAPSAPGTSIESGPADKLLPSHFDWCEPALRTAGLSLTLAVFRAGDGSQQGWSSVRYYGPLHQRPPPSLS